MKTLKMRFYNFKKLHNSNIWEQWNNMEIKVLKRSKWSISALDNLFKSKQLSKITIILHTHKIDRNVWVIMSDFNEDWGVKN